MKVIILIFMKFSMNSVPHEIQYEQCAIRGYYLEILHIQTTV